MKLPKLFRRRIIQTLLISAAIFLVGLFCFFLFQDRILLGMSLILTSACIYDTWDIYQIAIKQKYEVISGECLSVSQTWRASNRRVQFCDNMGVEWNFRLNRRFSLQKGKQYRFYLKSVRSSVEVGFLEDWINSSRFIGCEEL